MNNSRLNKAKDNRLSCSYIKRQLKRVDFADELRSSSDMYTLVGILLSVLFSCAYCSQQVYIVPDGESEKPLNSVTINEFCQSAVDNSKFIISSGNHNLTDTFCEVKGVQNVTLGGDPVSKPVIKCFNSSFGFLNVTTLTISNIMFTGCGTTWTTSQVQLKFVRDNISSALLFVNGSNHNLTDLTLHDSITAGVYIYNVARNVSVNSCEVVNASSYTNDTLGGNIVVYDENMTADSANLFITDSHISNSGCQNKSACKEIYNTHPVQLLFSSGLAMVLGSSKLTVSIHNTNFTNNTGCTGGNMAVYFFKFMPLHISRSSLIGGHSLYGGAVIFSFQNSFVDWIYDSIKYRYNSSNVLTVSDSRFINNTAEYYGGAVSVFWKESLVLNGSADLKISNSIFDNNLVNQSKGGMALYYQAYLEESDDLKKVPKLFISLNISNCTFRHHTPLKQEPGYSVIQTLNVPYFGIDSIAIEHNDCTAIQAVASTLVFYGSTSISHNRAVTGGGMELCSGAVMYLTPHLNLTVTNNYAERTGGGLQVSLSNCLLSIPKCFFQYTREVSRNLHLLKTINFTIANNTAETAGDNVYGGSMDFCYLLRLPRRKYNLSIHVPYNNHRHISSIASDPYRVCIPHPASLFHCETNTSARVYPGEKMSIWVRVVGQYYGAVKGTVVANSSHDEVPIEESERSQTVNKLGSNVTYTVYQSSSNFTGATLYLKAGFHNDNDYNTRHPPVRVFISFKKCPFGFVNDSIAPSSKWYACKCIESKKILITNCSIQYQTITKLSRSWLGNFEMNNQTYLAFNKYCPFDYCNSSFLTLRSGAHNISQDEQCQYNRTGILCGSCPPSQGLVLGSSECRANCSNVWLLLIVPFALAGLLLVLLVHLLNLTVTVGTICGLIFYANVLQDYSIIILSSYPIPVLTPILRVFLSWLNLDLGISTCFYEGMDAFGKTMLLFIFPIYIWLISAVIIFLSNRYISFTRAVGENSLKILSTLFLLSYSKMIRVTIGVFNFKFVKIFTSGSITTSIRWAMDGNIPYFNPQRHLVAFVIATVFACLLLPFAISLLCISRLFSLSNYCAAFSWIDKLKPFFDTYTGPFKDKTRFWTGLLLLVRVFLLVVRVLDFHYDVIPYYIIIFVCLSLSLTMAAFGGVYKRHCLNLLEHFFIWNMAIIFLVHTYIGGVEVNRSVLCHTLVSSAFIVFLGIITYHCYLKIPMLGLVRRVEAFCCRRADSELESLLNDSFDGERNYGTSD